MAKKILIFGGYGFVGGTVAKLSKKNFKTTIVSSSKKAGFDEFDFHQADITDYEQVRKVFEAVKPDVAINTAAMSDIDKSEIQKDLAHKINVQGAANIARASREHGAKYIFISSDAVFDGKSNGNTESDTPAPVNYYGTTKYEAERVVADVNPNSTIVRVSLVLGIPVNGGNSFLSKVKESLATGKEVPCPVDEIRSPVDVLTLSESILELAENDFKGLLHVASTESTDRYTLTQKLSGLLGHNDYLIKAKPPSPHPLPGKAPRHKKGILKVEKAQSVLKTKMLNLEETLRRAMASETFFGEK